VQDKLAWWGDVAKQAYEAIDGSLQGFEAAEEDKTLEGQAGMSGPEAEMVKVGALWGRQARMSPLMHAPAPLVHTEHRSILIVS
jgi:hypothetical protein